MGCAPSHASAYAGGFIAFMSVTGVTSSWGGLSKGEKDAVKDEAVSKALAQAGKT